MKVWEYENYEEYKKEQVAGNKMKLNSVWVKQESIQEILKLKPFAGEVICHGTRNGREQELFKKFLPGCFVIGTEISDTATKFPNTIEWDFHEVKEEFVNRFDILYSNSFDHSYDPEKCLRTWKDQINPLGIMALELMTGIENVSRPMDPLEISVQEFEQLAMKIGLRVQAKFNMIRTKTGKQNAIMIVLKK